MSKTQPTTTKRNPRDLTSRDLEPVKRELENIHAAIANLAEQASARTGAIDELRSRVDRLEQSAVTVSGSAR